MARYKVVSSRLPAKRLMPLDKRKTDNELSYGFNLSAKTPDRSVVKSYQVTSTGTGCEKVTIVSCTPSTMGGCWLPS